jgi:hypothetical protein
MLTSRINGEIKLDKEIYQRHDPFSQWRKSLDNETMLVAAIPFLRNLAEFSGDDASYSTLTSLLHIKNPRGRILGSSCL